MKEKIYTIPVNEAFDTDCECPFCELEKKTDADILDYVLGPSYMEEDIREETNKKGFCKYHYDKMFHAQNRLGVALMVSTHLKTINKALEDIIEKEKDIKRGVLLRKDNGSSPTFEYIDRISSSCYACERISSRMDSYFDTFYYLWKAESEFRNKVKNSKGFCLNHLSRIISEGRNKLNRDKFHQLLDTLAKLQKENLSRVDEELDWFIQKFDYRFHDEPWKNSKDALERAILKISSTRL